MAFHRPTRCTARLLGVRGSDLVRFQNYRAVFTILKADTVTHSWLQDLVDGVSPADSLHCPPAWRAWVRSSSISELPRRLHDPESRHRHSFLASGPGRWRFTGRLVALPACLACVGPV